MNRKAVQKIYRQQIKNTGLDKQSYRATEQHLETLLLGFVIGPAMAMLIFFLMVVVIHG